MKREWYTLGIHLGYRYDGSPIVWPDGTPAPPLEIATYTQTARPGARAPHAWLPDGRSTLDLFGRGFTLLALGADAPQTRGLRTAAAQAGVPLHVVEVDRRTSPSSIGAGSCWFVPTGTWRGAPMPSRRTRARSSTSCAGHARTLVYGNPTKNRMRRPMAPPPRPKLEEIGHEPGHPRSLLRRAGAAELLAWMGAA